MKRHVGHHMRQHMTNYTINDAAIDNPHMPKREVARNFRDLLADDNVPCGHPGRLSARKRSPRPLRRLLSA